MECALAEANPGDTTEISDMHFSTPFSKVMKLAEILARAPSAVKDRARYGLEPEAHGLECEAHGLQREGYGLQPVHKSSNTNLGFSP